MIAQFAPIVLAFGANLGERAATIAAAQAELASHSQIAEFQASPLVNSVKMTLDGPDAAGQEYLNGVATAVTTLTASELLALVQKIELRHGRVRSEKWADRTLDIDIIMYAGVVTRTPELTLPHPLAHTRDFVLAPWLMLDKNAVLLRHGRVSEILERIGNTTEIYQEDNSV